ncbi:hypothetical protein [Pelagerythrobacter aerophilus]|uniref:Uncharacterized protein n=1 Tax=Pelagerythrobacter aerophilus TaxID=2306995 RepID=A0A418NK62_9SPHN|nr:hypothetical protein [Pelagerythrobacter aerophilus]RIV79552.1 hypothetical protein D2V04_06160 [Pelagerythrobacter aerophilus]
MDLITIGTTAAIAVPTIAAVALYMDRRTLRKRLSVLNGRVSTAEDIHARQRTRINQLENQAASDGNRLSQLRVQNNQLTRQRDAARDERDQIDEQLAAAEEEVRRLQPLADKALAAQAQRVRASQAAKAKRDARKATA